MQEGNVGAGAGATVGKIGGGASGNGGPMKGGIGSAAITLPNGLVVAAIVAVNAVGDIIDPATGPGRRRRARTPTASCADARKLLRGGARRAQRRAGENTTIGVVATNAKLTKVQAQKMAQMAHDGYARAISPVHTPGDGDTIFSLATGTLGRRRPNYGTIGALAAEAMADAIVRAATQATAIARRCRRARDLGTVPAPLQTVAGSAATDRAEPSLRTIARRSRRIASAPAASRSGSRAGDRPVAKRRAAGDAVRRRGRRRRRRTRRGLEPQRSPGADVRRVRDHRALRERRAASRARQRSRRPTSRRGPS